MMDYFDQDNELSDKDYFDSRVKDRLYVSKRFEDKYSKKNKRFVHKINESEQQEKFVKEKNEFVLAVKHGGRYQLKALVIEDSKGIESLIIQTFTIATGNPHKAAFSFRGSEVENLYKFLKGIKEVSFENKEGFKVDDDRLEKLLLSKEQASKIILDNEGTLIEALKNNITKSDIVALGYRKNQLEKFERLLSDEEFFNKEKNILNAKGKEAVWQKFFEKNSWIFGYGLNYVFNSPVECHNK